MRKIFTIAFAASTIIMSSCGAKQQIVDKMADEVCQAMSKYKEEDPITLLEAATGLEKVSSNEKEYKDVTEAQLESTLEKNCPDGFKKYKKLIDQQK